MSLFFFCMHHLETRRLAVDLEPRNPIRNALGPNPILRPVLIVVCNLLQHARARRHEAQIRAAGIQHARQVLRVELDADEPRVVFDLDDLHAHARLVLADKRQPALFQRVDVLRVDLVSVAMALEDLVLAGVQRAETGPLAAVLKERGAEAETHRCAHGRLVDFGHEHDELVGRGAVEFFRRRVLDAAYVARVLDDGDLHAQADAKVRLLVLARPGAGGNHAFGGALAEAAGDEDPRGLDDFVPCGVVFGRVGRLAFGLEVVRVDPADIELFLAAHGSVFQALHHRQVRVLQLDVFAHQCDRDGVVVSGVVVGERLPLLPDLVALVRHGGGDVKGFEVEELADHRNESLLLKEHGDLVDRGHVPDNDDLLGIDLAEVCNLLDGRRFKLALATTSDLNWSAIVQNSPFLTLDIPDPGSDHYSSPP